MAQTITAITDTGGNVYTGLSEICEEDLDGNLFFTIDGVTANTNLDAWLNHPAYINGVDNMDGTWTFEMNPELLDSAECIPTYEDTPTPCVDECPEVVFRQGFNDGNAYAIISVLDDTVTTLEINTVLYSASFAEVITAPTGDCIVYDIEIVLDSGCTFTFTITLPACDWYGSITDCTTVDLCVSYVPTLSYVCDNASGLVTVTTNPDGGTIISETLEWSCDGLTWTPFVTSFTPNCDEGFIRWTVDLDDTCPPYEVIEAYLCPLDCENSSECECTYDEINDEFTITCTDTIASPISTETLVYYKDGGLIPFPFTLGVPIPAVGINRIDWSRTIEFSDTCPDLVLTGDCAKVDDCDYTGYSLSCEFDNNLMTGTPTFNGDETILTTNTKEYSVDGSTFGIYTGGGIHTGLFVTFRWTIQIEGCDPYTLVSTCGYCDKCSDIGVTINGSVDVNLPDCIYTLPCDEAPLDCQESCQRSGYDVTAIQLADGTALSTGFSFPYTTPISGGTLIADLQTYVTANGGGDVLLETDGSIDCIKVYNSPIRFGLVTWTNGAVNEGIYFAECEVCDWELCRDTLGEGDNTLTDIEVYGYTALSADPAFNFPYADTTAGWQLLCDDIRDWMTALGHGNVDVECEADICNGVGSFRITIKATPLYFRVVRTLESAVPGFEVFTKSNCV